MWHEGVSIFWPQIVSRGSWHRSNGTIAGLVLWFSVRFDAPSMQDNTKFQTILLFIYRSKSFSLLHLKLDKMTKNHSEYMENGLPWQLPFAKHLARWFVHLWKRDRQLKNHEWSEFIIHKNVKQTVIIIVSRHAQSNMFLWNLKTQCDLPQKFHRPQVIEVEASQSQRIKAEPHTHGTAEKTERRYII